MIEPRFFDRAPNTVSSDEEMRFGHHGALDAAVATAAGIEWSARVVDVSTGQVLWEHDPTRVLKTASIGKLFLLIEVARRCEAGELDLGERVARTDVDRIADSGLWHLLAEPSLTIDDACVLIGAVSDNLATNVLLRRVGLDAVTATTLALGFEASRLLDRVRAERRAEHPPALSVGNADELVRLAAGLYRGTVISPAVSDRVLGWLAGGTDLSMVASAFGLDPLAHVDRDRDILLRNKTGTISTARADVGVVEGPRAAVAYAVLANWPGTDVHGGNAPTPDDRRDAVLAAMAEIGAAIRDAVSAP
jgi:Beta-lactamase class A